MTCFRERARSRKRRFQGQKSRRFISENEQAIWRHTRHQDEAIEPRRVCSVDVKGGKEISLKSLILSHSPDLTSRSITETYHSMGTYQPHRFRDDFDTFHIV